MGFVEQHESNASYTTVESVSKPNISAPYSVDIPNIGTRNGTSFATPQVTGVLALLFQALKVRLHAQQLLRIHRNLKYPVDMLHLKKIKLSKRFYFGLLDLNRILYIVLIMIYIFMIVIIIV